MSGLDLPPHIYYVHTFDRRPPKIGPFFVVIIPCSVSYEIDPLAKEKASHLQGEINKQADEDISHIFKGVMEHKGKVSLKFAEQLQGQYSPEELAKAIDNSILNN